MKNNKQESFVAPDQDDCPDDTCNNCTGAELTLQKGNHDNCLSKEKQS
jgi:hypothetical protein